MSKTKYIRSKVTHVTPGLIKGKKYKFVRLGDCVRKTYYDVWDE